LDRKEREPTTGPALCRVGFAVATSLFAGYWIWLSAFSSFCTTSLGNLA
jgi:hypothetical protein